MEDEHVLRHLVTNILNIAEEEIGDEVLQGHVHGAREVAAVELVWETAVDDVKFERQLTLLLQIQQLHHLFARDLVLLAFAFFLLEVESATVLAFLHGELAVIDLTAEQLNLVLGALLLVQGRLAHESITTRLCHDLLSHAKWHSFLRIVYRIQIDLARLVSLIYLN